MALNGWIILDKPSGISSAQAVARVKRLLKPKKIGHAGTLDPLASGVLPLALGEATKTIQYMMEAGKAYAFTVTWGEARDTDDSQGQVIARSDKRPSTAEIEAILPRFTGEIEQMPPQFSALKVDGKRAYDLAREGKIADLKPRKVRVDSLQFISPSLTLPPSGGGDFVCHCGKGTYIRSIARDMGEMLGCYGHISMLRRLKVGAFGEDRAISLEMLEKIVHKGDLSFLLPVGSALDDIPALDVTASQAMLLQRGQALSLTPNVSTETVLAKCEGVPVAICEASQGQVRPVRVFNI